VSQYGVLEGLPDRGPALYASVLEEATSRIDGCTGFENVCAGLLATATILGHFLERFSALTGIMGQ